MLHLVLYQPEIPPNTGNLMRLSANTGFALHLIEPLGFTLLEKQLRRAGLDYRDTAHTRTHRSWEAFLAEVQPARVFGISTRGSRHYHTVDYAPGDAVVFGPETRGLPADLLAGLGEGQVLRLPMQPGSRSLNLANAVSIVAYEAWRQWGFPGGG